MPNTKWNVEDIPDQHGKRIVVTGANSGIGYEAALALAGKGAEVILAVRNLQKGEQACVQIHGQFPDARVEVMPLDLADLASVRRFADAFMQRYARSQVSPATCDVLINNAGVMALPFRRTVDGFEMQFGTNHLGHFALTGLMLPAMLASPTARVVTVSSLNHMMGSIDFENLGGEKRYGKWQAYNRCKLANVLFAYELQRRLAASGARTISVCCHPGYAATNLQFGGPNMSSDRLTESVFRIANRVLAQSAAMGALPTLYAATSPNVAGGDFIGPDGIGGAHGHPRKARSSAPSHDVATAKKLWQVSERLTGVRYAFDQDS
jgi:NAD(P)-dependent dehydrogenase (short-subunit alcohol dehydrogenase family)